MGISVRRSARVNNDIKPGVKMRDTTKPKKSLQHRAQEKTDKYCSDRLQNQN